MGYTPPKNPVFSGDPRGVTAAEGDSDTTLATTAFVQTATGSASSNRPAVTVGTPTGTTSGTTTIASGAEDVLKWGSESYDTDAMHDLTTNTSRVTVTSSGRHQIDCIVRFNAVATTGQMYLVLKKNGSVLEYGESSAWVNSATVGSHVTLGIQDNATAGDYYEVAVYQATGAGRVMAAGRFSVGWVGGTGAAWGNAGASVYKTTNQTMTLASTYYNVTFDAETFDIDGMHSTSSNTDRLTVVTPGTYEVATRLMVANTASAVYWAAAIMHYNSSGTLLRRVAYAEASEAATAVSAYHAIDLSGVAQGAIGDYFVVQVQTSLASQPIYGDNTGYGTGAAYFSAVRVGYQTNPSKVGQVTNGRATSTANQDTGSIANGTRSTTLLSVTVTGDGVTDMEVVCDFPSAYLFTGSTVGLWTLEVWDGTVGSGTKIGHCQMRWTATAQENWGAIHTRGIVSAFTGSKTFTVVAKNSSGGASRLVLQQGDVADKATLTARWLPVGG